MNIHINQLKRQLNIELTYTNDDAILQQMLTVAEQAVGNYVGSTALTGYTGTTMPISVEQAVIMLAAHFYLNRNMISFAQGVEVPYTFRFILDPYKDYVVK